MYDNFPRSAQVAPTSSPSAAQPQQARRRALRCTLVLPAMAAAGCAPPILGASATTPRSGDIVMADLRHFRLGLALGQIGEIRLPSNPSTGYRWALVEPSTDLLTLLDHDFTAARSELMGAPGEERWSFQAVRKGAGELRFEYRRPWEPVEIAPAQRTSFRVDVG